MKSKVNQIPDYRQVLNECYPGEWALGLVKVCQPLIDHTHYDKANAANVACGEKQMGKRAMGVGWNKLACERYEHGLKGRDAHIETVVGWLEAGFNVGLCPPLAFFAVDCDNSAAVDWWADQTAPDTPRQCRADDSAHYIFRMPEGVQYKSVGVNFEGLKFDLRVGGRSMIVATPSIHRKSNTRRTWAVPLTSAMVGGAQ
jgi:hypothetical protein